MGTSNLNTIVRSAEITLENRIYFNYYFFECTLNDTLTAKMPMFSRQHPNGRPESLICT